MVSQTKLLVRPAEPQDRRHLASLIHFETHVHRHLDWRPPLDWLGHSPYLIAEAAGHITATLACPPDPPNAAWIRLFAFTSNTTAEEAWHNMWPVAQETLAQFPQTIVVAITLQKWFRQLLAANNFINTHNVVLLSWEHGLNNLPPSASRVNVRPMTHDDIPQVHQIDTAAFEPIWRNSQQALQLAFKQAVIATVAEDDNGSVLGYQISTPAPMGVHLARLAVLPRAQGQGIGYGLVRDLLEKFEESGDARVSVNTQDHNHASLALYKKAGFTLTDEAFPVFQYQP